MAEKTSPISEQVAPLPFDVRVKYWLHFARGEHRREMELLLGEAKLGGRPHKVDGRWEGWNNVMKHQVGEAAAMRVLGKALKLSPDQIARQEMFSFVHDAEKHAQIKPGDFASSVESNEGTISEKEVLMSKLTPIYEEADSDGRLRVATNEEFFYKLFERTEGTDIDAKIANTPQDELLQYYIDGIFVDGTITPPLERIAKTEARRQDLNEDAERQKRLGMKYWDAERLVATKVEALIAEWLEEQGIPLPSPEHLPHFLRQKIEQEMVMHWLEAHGSRNVMVDLERGSSLEVETLIDTKRTATSGDIAPEKNEDAALVQQKGNIIRFGVWDGATDPLDLGEKLQLPLSTGKAAAITCRQGAAGAPWNTTSRELLKRGNELLAGIAAGLPLTDMEKSEALTAVGAAGRLDLETMTMDFASVADCHIMLLHKDGSHTWLTKNTSVHCELLEIAAAVWGAEHPQSPLPEDAQLLEFLDTVMNHKPEARPAIQPLKDPRVLEVIARNRRLENDLAAGGQPSLKGSPDDQFPKECIQDGVVAVKQGDEIFAFSDGAYPGPLYTPEQQKEIADVIAQGGIQGLRDWVYAKEAADPSLQNPPRMKQFDDFIALRIKVPAQKTGDPQETQD